MENTTSSNQNPAVPGQPSQPVALEAKKAPDVKVDLGVSTYFDTQTWGVMKMMAQTFLDARAFPTSIQNVPQAMTILQAGRELGLKPIESLSYIALINGRPSLWGDKAIEMVVAAGHRVEWGACNDKTATCTITRGDTNASMTATFTMEMAIARGLTSKGGPWKTAPDNMLKFKAFHSIAKFIVPDALRSMGIAEIDETEIPNKNHDGGSTNSPVNVAVLNSNKVEVKTDALQDGSINRPSLSDRLAKREAEKNQEKPAPIEGQVVTEPEKTKSRKGKVTITHVEGTEAKEEDLVESAPESETVKKMKAAAIAGQEAAKAELPDPRDSGAEFVYKRLIEEEMAGRQLTKLELTFINKYLNLNKS